MKIEFWEGDFGTSVSLRPETMAEVNALLRMSANSAAVKPDICFSFSDDDPTCSIWLKKRNKSIQISSIKP